MSAEIAVRTRLAGLSPVTSLTSTRIYQGKIREGTAFPCVLVRLVDETISYQLRGPIGTVPSRVQVDAIVQETSGADPYASLMTLADAIEGNGAGEVATGLSGFIGTVGGTEIAACFQVARTFRYDPEELRILTMSHDYIVWVKT